MWLNDWKYRIPFTVPASKIGETLTHFPAYLKISESSGLNSADLTKVFDELEENKLKFALTKADGISQLFAEIERWNAENRIADIHYSRSGFSLNPLVDNKLFLYFDPNKPDNTDFVGVTGSTPAKAVWDSAFKMVQHMNDNPDTSHIKDSTSNDNDGTKKAANEPIETIGKIAGSQNFSDDYIQIASNAEITPTGQMMIECWIKLTDTPDDYDEIIKKYVNDAPSYGYVLGATSNKKLRMWINDGDWQFVESDTVLDIETQYHIAGVYDGTNIRIFVNGVEEGTPQAQGAPVTNSEIMFIGAKNAVPDYAIPAEIDEIRLTIDSWCSSAWVGASYETQRDQYHQFDSVESKPFHVPFILTGRAKA